MLEIIIALFVYFGDMRMKKYAEANMEVHHNYGSAANFGAGNPKRVRVLSIILTAVVSVLFVASLTRTGKHLLKTGLAFVLGGAFSNTYDRIKHGYVIDYVKIPIGHGFFSRLRWNIADFAIIIGALLVAIEG